MVFYSAHLFSAFNGDFEQVFSLMLVYFLSIFSALRLFLFLLFLSFILNTKTKLVIIFEIQI